MQSRVAAEWLAARARTANARDLDAHLDLISRQVVVHGVPGFEAIGYADWARQCRHEFAQGVLQRVAYDGLTVTAMSPGRVMFETLETLEGSDGTVRRQGVEIVLHKEADGKWRVTQERILSPDEMAYDRARA